MDHGAEHFTEQKSIQDETERGFLHSCYHPVQKPTPNEVKNLGVEIALKVLTQLFCFINKRLVVTDPILLPQFHSWHVHCLIGGMAVFIESKASQTFDDSRFFQRLTLIDICCGPPLQS